MSTVFASRLVARMMIGSRTGKAVMIQHNDSDTSCMRAYALLERTLASVAELPLGSCSMAVLSGTPTSYLP